MEIDSRSRIKFLLDVLQRHLVIIPRSYVGLAAWVKQANSIINKVRGALDTLDETSKVILVEGECKIIQKTYQGEIAVPATFRVFFQGITEEDSVKIVCKKLNFVNLKTISIKTLKLEEVNFNKISKP